VPGLQHRRSNDNECGHPTVYPQLGALDPDPPRGVLDLALRATDPAARPTLDTVHRFIHTDDAGRMNPDTDYAELTLAMRRGQDPKAAATRRPTP
jgi:hypothetical protein